ncbi:hypothetical protein GWK08_06940 [Leptobacterium flavescens]|uniref:DUF1579 domain-containing protein n=1 Tax=Leptobacterium flavescens TaxID=472055 RepID=A0A6P0UMS3_9FLAO|nr:hypothetical protein [Leptobacterium flavescens]NER13168.1 hypothetical protein [Leptobacterium flavescens]
MYRAVILFFLLISFTGLSQEMNEKSFDFWVGEWDLSWTNAKGTTIKGNNSIVKILDGKVIQENFTDPSTGFKGTSISVFNPQTKQWHQAWADSQGGYIDLIGAMDGEKRIFKTKPVQQGDKKVVRRMVFKDISENGFTWDWESTTDGGENWKLLWRIEYSKKAH